MSTRGEASDEGDTAAASAETHDNWVPIQSVSQPLNEPLSAAASPDDVIFDFVGSGVHAPSGGGGGGTNPPPPPPPPPHPPHDDDTMEGMDAAPELVGGGGGDTTVAWELENVRIASYDMSGAASSDDDAPVVIGDVPNPAEPAATEHFFTVELDEGPVALTDLQPDGVMVASGVAESGSSVFGDASDLLFGGDDPAEFDDI